MPFFDDAALRRILKLLTVCAAGGLLALGLCGIDTKLHPHASWGGGIFAVIAAIIGVPSEFGLVVAVLALIVFGIGRLVLRLKRK